MISDRDGTVDVTVRDNGKGFDAQESSAGFGLLGIRERLALVKGTLKIESAPGAGTTLHISISCSRRGHRLIREEHRERRLHATRDDDHGAVDRVHQTAADAADRRTAADRSRASRRASGRGFRAFAELVGRVAGEPDAVGLDVLG